MNQGFSQLIIFVVSCAFTQEVLNLTLESDNSIPIVGGNLILSCLTPDFFKDGVIYWFNPNGTELSRCYPKRGGVCDRNTSSYSFTANISGAYANIDGLERARDGGKWKCTQIYEHTSKVDTIEIVIYNAPEINVTVTGSDRLNMTWNVTCEASGFPTNYTFHPWKQILGEVTIRSDLQGTHEGIINSSKNTLTLNRLSLQDKGTYVCSVDSGVRGVNGDTMQTSSTVLNVKGTPVVVDKINVTFTEEIGSSANIYIAFYSDPVVTDFKFQRNGSDVENTSRTLMCLSTNIVEVLFYNKSVNLTVSMARLLIMNLTKDDFDDYNLVLENSIGKTDFKVQLNAAGHPSIVATFYYNRFLEGEIEFHFDPGFNGGRNQTFVIEYSSVTSFIWTNTSITDLQEEQTEHRLPNGTYFVTVTKPSPGDYIYRIFSKNSIGRSPYSMNVSVSIPQDKKTSNANPLVAPVVGSIVAATVMILGVAATRILMKKGIFSTKKSSGAYQSRRPIRSLRDDIGAVFENMPVLNVNVDNEYVNVLTVRQFGAGVQDDAESVYENRNDVDLTLLRSDGDLIYVGLEMAVPKENNGKPIIHGLQNRTEYAEIAFDKLE